MIEVTIRLTAVEADSSIVVHWQSRGEQAVSSFPAGGKDDALTTGEASFNGPNPADWRDHPAGGDPHLDSSGRPL